MAAAATAAVAAESKNMWRQVTRGNTRRLDQTRAGRGRYPGRWLGPESGPGSGVGTGAGDRERVA